MLLLGPGLLSTTGARHKRQRKMLNPVFSAAHMRSLTPLFHDVAGKVRVVIRFLRVHISADAHRCDHSSIWQLMRE